MAEPAEIVQRMYERDMFSQWLGVSVDSVGAGRCRLSMVVRAEMLNGFGIAHGGIAYALADSAMAFASNSYGRVAVALTNTVSYPEPVHQGQTLVAVAEERSKTNRTATYDVTIASGGRTVALFRGSVFVTDREHGVGGEQ